MNVKELVFKAGKGDVSAMYCLGTSFELSGKVEQALKWYLAASIQGSKIAHEAVSRMKRNYPSLYRELGFIRK